jgi:DNA polymerase-3 subunit epsilon
VLDSLALAREKFPGQRNSLDALCRRLGIDNSHRELHGALLDAQLLAQVYVELTGGRQIGLTLVTETVETATTVAVAAAAAVVRPPRTFAANPAELAAHAAFLKEIANPLWLAEA